MAGLAGIAAMLWELRVLVVAVIALLAVKLLLEIVPLLLPVSQATRARWKREEELSDQFPSFRYRPLMLIGMAMILVRVLAGRVSSIEDIWAEIVIACVGAIAALVWRIRHAHKYDGPNYSLKRTDQSLRD